MKKHFLGITAILMGAMIFGGISYANISGIDISQNAAGKYELKLPTIIDARNFITIVPNASMTFAPVFTSANDSVLNLGFQQSRYDLTVGTSFGLGIGRMSLDAGLSYRPPMNYEGYLETMQTTISGRWFFIW